MSAWVVGPRRGITKKLVNAYKFERVRSAHKQLAALLDANIPELPRNTVVVPIPTITRHIRERGYDHCMLLARTFARHRRLAYAPLLLRTTNTVQRGADKRQREIQAEKAFSTQVNLAPDVPYLLLDDIITTGSTFQWAAKTLKTAGAETIWAAAVAQQPLDE
jgi:ComF family protein